jgi:hypothetical protein
MPDELFVIIIGLLINGANADLQNLSRNLQTYIHINPYVTVFYPKFYEK